MSVLEINFFAGSKYLLLGIKASSKTWICSSKSGMQKISPTTIQLSIVRFMTKDKIR